MGIGAKRFTELRAWEACDIYKKAVLRLCKSGTLARDFKLRDQLEGSVCGPSDNLAEGFGRFNPPDFARYTVMARASLMESQNQLMTAVDKGHITEEVRLHYNQLAETALEETTGLMDYLQSPEALRNARLARERRDAKRAAREPRTARSRERPTSNAKPRDEPGTTNRERRTENPESNVEPGMRTEHRAHRTEND